MTTDTTVSPFQHPDTIDDPLTSVLREGARRLLAEAIEAEAEAFLAALREERLADGRARFVRHGHGPERVIQTGIGPVPVKRAKVRDRAGEESEERVTYAACAPISTAPAYASLRSSRAYARASSPWCALVATKKFTTSSTAAPMLCNRRTLPRRSSGSRRCRRT